MNRLDTTLHARHTLRESQPGLPAAGAIVALALLGFASGLFLGALVVLAAAGGW